jgi:hypothetical protein
MSFTDSSSVSVGDDVEAYQFPAETFTVVDMDTCFEDARSEVDDPVIGINSGGVLLESTERDRYAVVDAEWIKPA